MDGMGYIGAACLVVQPADLLRKVPRVNAGAAATRALCSFDCAGLVPCVCLETSPKGFSEVVSAKESADMPS